MPKASDNEEKEIAGTSHEFDLRTDDNAKFDPKNMENWKSQKQTNIEALRLREAYLNKSEKR